MFGNMEERSLVCRLFGEEIFKRNCVRIYFAGYFPLIGGTLSSLNITYLGLQGYRGKNNFFSIWILVISRFYLPARCSSLFRLFVCCWFYLFLPWNATVSRVVRLKRNVISLNVNLMRFKYEETVFCYFYWENNADSLVKNDVCVSVCGITDLLGIFVGKKIYFILKAKWITI